LRSASAGRRIALLLVLCSVLGCASFEGARLYRSGTRALDAGDSARAVTDLERAAQLVPQGSEIQNHLGLAYAAAGDDAKALAAFTRAVEIDCENQAAQQNLATARRRALEVP
jgi:Flp pilus assembly protein TadD